MMSNKPPSISQEYWKKVTCLDGNYWVSTEGRLKNFLRLKDGRVVERIVKGSICPTTQYVYFYYKKNGKAAAKTLHSIIADTFLGPRPKGLMVNHIDHNRLNNRLSNLEYVTRQENVRQAVAMGKYKKGPMKESTKQKLREIKKGSIGSGRKLTRELVLEIRRIGTAQPCTHLASQYGVDKKTILNIRHNRIYKEWQTD